MQAVVTVWHIPLRERPTADDLALLDAAERRRAERFLREADRWHYVRAHAAMRRILAAETGCQPDRLVFVANKYGKPALADGSLNFNLSHSGDHAVLATSLDAEVGIDIEGRTTDILGIARLVLSDREMEGFSALPAGGQEAAFLRAWTRKEALLKAVGCGLALDPCSVEVGLADVPETPDLAGQSWMLSDFTLAPGTGLPSIRFLEPGRKATVPANALAGCLAANKKIAPVDIRFGAIE